MKAGASGEAGTRQATPYLYIGGPKRFLTRKVLVEKGDDMAARKTPTRVKGPSRPVTHFRKVDEKKSEAAYQAAKTSPAQKARERNRAEQAGKASTLSTLSRVGRDKPRPVTIAQVQNDKTIKDSDKQAIIKVLRQKKSEG